MTFCWPKARLAVEENAFMPAVNDGVHFKLNKARHPLIDKKKVVPVDIALGYDYDTLVITGPNTGGKTVSLENRRPAQRHGTAWLFDPRPREQLGLLL